MPQPAAKPRRFRWRRLLQYRLRTLLIVMSDVAVWLGCWSHAARRPLGVTEGEVSRQFI